MSMEQGIVERKHAVGPGVGVFTARIKSGFSSTYHEATSSIAEEYIPSKDNFSRDQSQHLTDYFF